MKHHSILERVACVLFTALLVLFCEPSSAQATETEPQIEEAASAIVCDSAGNVLWSYNADERLAMASITKIMTAIVALDSGYDLGSTCTIVSVDLGSDSQTAGYATTDTPTMRELLQVMLVYSGNDCAYNVAVNVAGSEEAFVELMNEKAAEIGMTNTHFSNSHGLEEDDHYSTAADLAILGRYALENYPFIASTVQLRSVTGTVGGVSVTFESTDNLMDTYDGLLGIKTGAVASGTAFLGAAERDGITLYTCVLGCSTKSGRFTDTATLLDWAFETYEETEVANCDWVIDVRPYALNFGLTVITRATSGSTISTWPDYDTISYTTTRISAGLLEDPGVVVGYTTYDQEGRSAGTTVYETSLVWGTVPSVGVLQLPLYLSTATLEVTS